MWMPGIQLDNKEIQSELRRDHLSTTFFLFQTTISVGENVSNLDCCLVYSTHVMDPVGIVSLPADRHLQHFSHANASLSVLGLHWTNIFIDGFSPPHLV